MDKIIVGSGNVSGNIGSCEVKSTNVSVSFWSIKTVAVNSCTGQIVADNTYLSGDALLGAVLLGGIALFVFILAVGGASGIVMKD